MFSLNKEKEVLEKKTSHMGAQLGWEKFVNILIDWVCILKIVISGSEVLVLMLNFAMVLGRILEWEGKGADYRLEVISGNQV